MTCFGDVKVSVNGYGDISKFTLTLNAFYCNKFVILSSFAFVYLLLTM